MKKLMLSTALIVVTGAAVQAQEAGDMFYGQSSPMDIHASNFIGMRVYSTETTVDADAHDGLQTDWEDIGEINDLVLSRDGKVEAVLVDIGGFLGIGERQVAVDMDALRFVSDDATPDNASDFFVVMNAARANLEEAPAYEWTVGSATVDDMNATDDMAAADVDPVVVPRDPVTRDGYVAAVYEELTTEDLTGASVYDSTDEDVGEVSELIISESGQITQAVIDVGGFLGIGEKPVALDIGKLDILREDNGDDLRVYVPMSREELDAMPSYEG